MLSVSLKFLLAEKTSHEVHYNHSNFIMHTTVGVAID